MRFRLIACVGLMVLTSCGITKRQDHADPQVIPVESSLKQPMSSSGHIKVEVIKTPPILVPVVKKIAIIPKECQIHKPLPINPLPVAPVGGPGDTLTPDQKFALAQSYIWSLLNYIKVERQTQVQAWEDYMKDCSPEALKNKE